MTSILLTRRRAPPAARRTARSSCSRATIDVPLKPGLRLRLAAVARRDVLLLGVGERRLLVHRVEHLVIGRDPVRGELPLLPVPLRDAHQAIPGMVGARELHRRDETFGAEL